MIDCLQATGIVGSLGILDRDASLWGKEVSGVPVLGGDELMPQLLRQGARDFLVGLGGTGDNNPRRKLFELALRHGLAPSTVSHPAATRSPWATVGAGSVLLPGAVVNAGAGLGVNVIVNTGAIVEHDCVVGDHAHVATGAQIASSVRVGAGAHIGAGATVRQGITVGKGSIVGAGAVVVNDVEPWTVVVGVPARLLKRLRADESSMVSVSPKVSK